MDPDYSKDGRDPFLTRKLEPKDKNYQTSEEFAATHEDSSIRTSQLKGQSVTADKLADESVSGTTLSDGSVSNAKLANMATKTYKGRTSGSTGVPEDVAVATLKSDLSLNNVPNLDFRNTVYSGTYTPTATSPTNLDGTPSMSQAQYLVVDDSVTVSGRFTADPTAAVATNFEIDLPVASNIGAAEDVAGVAFSGSIAGQGAEVIGVAANNTAQIQWVAIDITSQTWSYTFTYQVI